MNFYRLATTKAGLHHGSGCSAAEEKWRNEALRAGCRKQLALGIAFPLRPPFFILLLGIYMGKIKEKGGRPGLGRCDRNCFCVFPCCFSERTSSFAVLLGLAVFVIAGG